jgi:hypothetical protein
MWVLRRTRLAGVPSCQSLVVEEEVRRRASKGQLEVAWQAGRRRGSMLIAELLLLFALFSMFFGSLCVYDARRIRSGPIADDERDEMR